MFLSLFLKAFQFVGANLKTFAIVAGVALILYFVIGFFNLRSELKDTQEQLAQSQAHVVQLETDIKDIQAIRDKLDKETAAEAKAKQDLLNKLNRPGKKSMTELAQKHPKLVEKAVNDGTKKAFKCLETLSAGGQC